MSLIQSFPAKTDSFDETPIHFESVDHMIAARRPSEPLYCLHPRRLRETAKTFLKGFPGRVLYAVKANPHPDVIRHLSEAGIRNFDTASPREIALIREICPEARCFYMAPCKPVGAIETNYFEHGLRDFVADHATEVDRLLALGVDDIRIHIRMKAFDPASVYELSSKFGAEPDETQVLLKRVQAAGLSSHLAFNVGSLCRDPAAYHRAILEAAKLAKAAGVDLKSLDVGGGFPIEYPGLGSQPLDAFFSAIRAARRDADLPKACELLCEPGRAMVARGQSLVTQVILVKDDLVFLNDGVYGGFAETKISNKTVKFPARVIRMDGHTATERQSFHVSGPTCDCLDIFPEALDLPVDIRAGDWIEFDLAGAYTNSMSTRFNGLYAAAWVTIDEKEPSKSV